MEKGITYQSLVPVRAKPGHAQEQVTQLLFGEMYSVEEKKGDWLRIITEFDTYNGWIHLKQHGPLSTAEYDKLMQEERSVAAELVQTVSNNDNSFPVLMGSTLYAFDGMNFKIGKEKFVYAGQAVHEDVDTLHGEHIRRFAMKFLHAPYQWGGRSPFGIDCSGFTQVVYKLYGTTLPRDAYQQAELGKTLHFIHEAREGDLAFFDDAEGKITHVGIVIQDGKIIHASGKVRLDTLDHHGIYNHEEKKYTHTLRILKRII